MDGQSVAVAVVIPKRELLDKVRALMESVSIPMDAYATPHEYLDRRESFQASCLLLTVRMPQMSGLELLRRLQDRPDAPPAIFLAEQADVPTAVEAMRQGAFDFLQTPVSEQHLLDRVNAAVRKHRELQEEAAVRTEAAARFRGLSPKEMAVLHRVTAGAMSKEIAREMGISLKTVEFHRANVMRKVGVDTVARLVYYYLVAGLAAETEQI